MNLFKFENEKLFNYIDDYNINALTNKLNNAFNNIKNELNIELFIDEVYNLNQDISSIELDKVLSVKVISQDYGLNATYNIEIPTIINGNIVKNKRRFIQKQLRDTLFVVNKELNYVRILPDIDLELDIHILKNRENENDNKTKSKLEIKGISTGNLIPMYLYLLKEGEEDKFKDIEYIQGEYEQYKDLSKEKLFKAITIYNSSARYKKSIILLKCLYIASELLKEYCTSAADMLFISVNSLKPENIDTRDGLNLINRRIRNIEEIIFSSILSQFIDLLSSDMELQALTRRNNIIRKIEITKDLYDLIQLEQLDSPLANLANKSKVTIAGGKSGFKKEQVPLSLKMLHKTSFGNLDPCITPDKEGTGVINYLSSSCKLDKYGRFLNINYLDEY